jgi:[ribosomal protein S18]-alanine N-acetyltransferase
VKGTAAAVGVAPDRRQTVMQVRLAVSRDLPRILEIERACFAQPWSLESFKRELLLPFSRILVAVSGDAGAGGQPAGFLCRWLVADECHILNVAVHPESRRCGIATLLMQRSIDEVKAKNSHFVSLEVRRSNLQARRLYRKLGFEEQRLRRDYYGPGEDAIVMELNLRAAR